MDGPWRHFTRGARDIVPVSIAAAPFGLLLGALGVQKGLSVAEMGAMSAFMFGGAAQFVVLDMWRDPAPVLAVLGATALVNSRHLLMGASLARKLEHFSPLCARLSLFFLVDEVWAIAERRALGGRLTPAYFLGLGVMLYVNWVLWTLAGAVAGAAIAQPERYGFDFALSAIFIGLIVGFWRGSGTGVIVATSALAATATHLLLAPGVWPVLIGGGAGLAVAAAFPGLTRGGEPT